MVGSLWDGLSSLPMQVPWHPGSRRSLGHMEESDGRRRRVYFWLMGFCILLIVLAWNVVRFYSITAAVVMSVIAAVIPPTAAVLANWGRGG
jgi:DUF3099 family protein